MNPVASRLRDLTIILFMNRPAKVSMVFDDGSGHGGEALLFTCFLGFFAIN